MDVNCSASAADSLAGDGVGRPWACCGGPWWRHQLRRLCARRTLFAAVPLLEHLRPAHYHWPRHFLNDFVAGLVICVMHIPMGMAYALLASLDPIYGLYASFFAPLVYALLGTSKHVSFGTFSIASIMVGACADRLLVDVAHNNSLTAPPNRSVQHLVASFAPAANASLHFPDTSPQRLVAIVTITFCAGLFQALFGCFRLGFLTLFLSDPLIDGFTTAVACHVFTSQLRYVLGLRKLPHPTSFFQLPETYVIIFKNIRRVNYYEMAISSVAMFFLFFTRWLTGLACFRSRFKWPIPLELLLVITATAISWAGDFKHNIGVNIVGHVPTGLPSPILIDPQLLPDVAVDAAVMAVVMFAVSYSMEKIMAKRHNYVVSPNQELVAFGVSNMVTACFRGFLGSVSLSRSLVQEMAGGQTQLTSIVSSGFMLLVLLVLGTWLQTLPKCILSSIVIVALYGMFKQALALPRLWRISRFDFSIWIVTFLATFCSSVAGGLGIGFSYSMLGMIMRARHAQTSELKLQSWPSKFDELRQWEAVSRSTLLVVRSGVAAAQLQCVRVVRVECSVTFLTAEGVAERLRAAAAGLGGAEAAAPTPARPARASRTPSLAHRNSADQSGLLTPGRDDDGLARGCVLVDLSVVALIDSTGAAALVDAWRRLRRQHVRLIFAAPRPALKHMLAATAAPADDALHLDVVERVELAVRDAIKCLSPRLCPGLVSSYSVP